VIAAMSCEVIELHSRGFIGANAHPEGCRRAVERQIAWVKDRAGAGWEGPRSVLVIGASTGYGLATRIVAAWGFHAATLGVFLERLPGNKRTASPGFYNTVAFHDCARKDGLLAACVNRDAFSRETKNQAVEIIRRTMPPLDLVIYSLAAPRRIDPESGHVHNAAIKPIGCAFTEKAIDIDSEEVVSIKIPPADEEEIADTISVMGGDDWQMWITTLLEHNLLSKNARTIAYSYVGPEYSWPIYKHGTIGRAKKHLEDSARGLKALLQEKLGGNAWVSFNQAIVSQSSIVIPFAPLYLSLLHRIMRDKGIQESPIEHIWRMFKDHLAAGKAVKPDPEDHIRLDDRELRPDVQSTIAALWPQISTVNLNTLTDFAQFKRQFHNLFGFDLQDVDYQRPTEVKLSWA
jgi:enoyl-[acyl-carrier protein] reductase/trans-2-enoyl-CoA reductase (NAD+)